MYDLGLNNTKMGPFLASKCYGEVQPVLRSSIWISFFRVSDRKEFSPATELQPHIWLQRQVPEDFIGQGAKHYVMCGASLQRASGPSSSEPFWAGGEEQGHSCPEWPLEKTEGAV